MLLAAVISLYISRMDAEEISRLEEFYKVPANFYLPCMDTANKIRGGAWKKDVPIAFKNFWQDAVKKSFVPYFEKVKDRKHKELKDLALKIKSPHVIVKESSHNAVEYNCGVESGKTGASSHFGFKISKEWLSRIDIIRTVESELKAMFLSNNTGWKILALDELVKVSERTTLWLGVGCALEDVDKNPAGNYSVHCRFQARTANPNRR
ncbi:unnamed protein product [Cylicocyclus nassatus]|uniref:Uncharacterized protein n=1 Tax=Cylicocyclus nassatus TaxID=53992 RepID=A0AA36DR30_CYLNA|nr:unnamed protein product [Cylicocyclus nassatus]